MCGGGCGCEYGCVWVCVGVSMGVWVWVWVGVGVGVGVCSGCSVKVHIYTQQNSLIYLSLPRLQSLVVRLCVCVVCQCGGVCECVPVWWCGCSVYTYTFN